MPLRPACCLSTLLLAGCSSFVPVRSASVEPGLRLEVEGSASTPPGEDAGWFYGLDCGASCDRSITSLSVGAKSGARSDGGRGYEVGGGFSGTFPYAEGFVQLRGGERPVGVGARVGLSRASWYEDVAYLAYDLAEVGGARLYATSSLFRHAGRSPNGQVGGSLTAFGQGVGLELGDLAPSVALVVASISRDEYGRRWASDTAFLVFGVRTVWLW